MQNGIIKDKPRKHIGLKTKNKISNIIIYVLIQVIMKKMPLNILKKLMNMNIRKQE